MQSSAGARAYQTGRLEKKLKKQADAVMAFAIEALGQGRLDEAELLCREILKEVPDHCTHTTKAARLTHARGQSEL
ncbi:MAG: hypothetical protein JHD07_33085, partial [Bradyrhizobium sp.]|uniref:hypothetical protein n=1 Tax=Bradyrhizobium sp. TaxID=376 RepID=UPI001A2E24A5